MTVLNKATAAAIAIALAGTATAQTAPPPPGAGAAAAVSGGAAGSSPAPAAAPDPATAGAGAAAATSGQTPTPPPAAAGAGAAAATSGQPPAAAPAAAGAGAAAATSGQPPAADAPAPAAETAAVSAPPTTLPNGTDIAPDHMENGRWYTKEGTPTFKIDNGVLDYASFSGYRRYQAECHVCHGPDGEGSTYAPALKNSVVSKLDYLTFQQIVASGKQDVNASANLVMPAFGTNPNVWCYVDDIYVYLLARGTNSLPRGRPAKKDDKSDEFATQENDCMGG